MVFEDIEQKDIALKEELIQGDALDHDLHWKARKAKDVDKICKGMGWPPSGKQIERLLDTSGILSDACNNVTDWLLDNSAFFWAFPIAGRSIESLRMFMNLSEEQLAYIPKLEKQGEGIFRDRRFGQLTGSDDKETENG